MMSSTVMQVENNTFAVPSQTREGKAHIVKYSPIECDIQVPNELAIFRGGNAPIHTRNI